MGTLSQPLRRARATRGLEGHALRPAERLPQIIFEVSTVHTARQIGVSAVSHADARARGQN